jgi:alkanesulfonate monooxygenase SsuD/methylene tetrahydromethanopterin reductase-like flavin-dependent oxidoreductase (luciferase family)
MGSKDQNFYNALAGRMGYGDAAAQVQELYLARKYDQAAAAIPFEFVDGTALLGPVERIADRMRAYADAGVTTLSLAPYGTSTEQRIEVLRVAAQAIDKAGVAA